MYFLQTFSRMHCLPNWVRPLPIVTNEDKTHCHYCYCLMTCVTLVTRYNHFPISPSTLSRTWSIVSTWPVATIITTVSHKGITCLIVQWIYIQQVIIGTTGYLWLMVCVSTVHAAFVFIWQSSPLSRAAAEISVPFGAYLWAIIFRVSMYPSH